MTTAAPPDLLPPRAIVHLGAHKTGSSLLQALFAAEAGRLAEAGIAWLPHQPFRASFSRRTADWRQDPAAAKPAMRAALAALLPPGRPSHAWLASDESLLGHLRTDLGNAPDRLYQHCGEVAAMLRCAAGPGGLTILLFIRRLDEFLCSAYLQRVRLGEPGDFGRYLAGLDPDRLSWVPTIRELAAPLTGEADRLVVHDHASLATAPGWVLQDLFGRLGAPAPPAAVLVRRVNPSLSDGQYRAMLRLNRLWPADRLPALRALAAGLIDRRAPTGGARPHLMEPGLAARLAARHAGDLAAIGALGGPVELALPPASPQG
ncbi:hypothetical protein [Falsiroseomonas oryzae]|uniref:hypothetical protein n=1 Tax=Falsiroseomonas oryzae TaxID=2766473 RepID=UPI0022EB221B|nr:hypothetical protein [Roseomonas sp. MO-31]